MGVVVASELLSCAGRPLSSAAGMTVEVQPQVTDEEAVTDSFIPADAVSAVLISPRRVLVTGGVLADERVLPLTVVRFLDLDASPRAEHAWTKPLQLRPTSKRGKRKRAESAFPYCRMEQTLTFVPECSSLFLIGGLKVGGKEEGKACKSMFSFAINTKLWDSVELAQTTKTEKEKHSLGPRFAHTAMYVPHVGGESRSSKARKSSGYILVFGGYVTTGDRMPCLSVHVFDVRTSRWSLQEPTGSAISPRRAYHAGVVTPSSRYIVVHGGQIAHFNESNFLSSDLFAFDIIRSEWIRPRLSPSSSTPPTARRRHCMVNGIGKHEGAILLFGGELCSGQFSNELFVLRIIETSNPDQSLSVVWEKVDVRSPEALVPMPEEHTSQQQQPSQEVRARHAATAGGCMLAVPELNKYLVIGGRGANGIRSSPLLLEASEVEKLDRLENILPRQVEQGGIPSVPAPQTGIPSTSPADEVVAVGGRTNMEKKMAVSPAQAAWRRQKRDENHIPLDRSKVKLRVREHSLDDVISPDRRTAGARRLSSLQPTRSDESPSLAPSRATAAGRKKSQNDIDGAHGLPPATSVRPVSAVEVGRRGPVVESDELFMDLVDTDDEFDVRRVREVSPGDPQDLETPPTKRRRFINGRRRGDDSSPRNDDIGRGSENGGVPGSAGSDFVAASELARKGKSRVAKSTRGRGRPRGGARRKRAETVAEDREALKEKEAEEALARENALLLKKLQSENTELQRERDTVKKDNLELNGQMKSLLSEVQGLRAFRRAHGPLKNASSPTRTKARSSAHDTSQDTGEIEPVGRASSRERTSRGSQSEELRMLHSKTADLMEEYAEIVAERNELNKAVKDAEEGNRALETELHHAKNKFERLETERDQLRKQASELRTLATSVTVERDTATSQLRKAEEGNSALKRELERLQDQLRDANSKRVEEKLQLSTAQRRVTTIRSQLNEANKKYDHFDSKERRLKGELESQQGKLSELQNLVNQTSAEKQKIEERTIELVTELETLKTDYEKKLRECQTAIKDAEKSRQALDREKKEAANLDMEVTKLKRDLARTQRVCNSLNLVMRKKDAAIHALQPAFVHFTNQFDALTRSAEADDLGHPFTQVNQCATNGRVTKRTERSKILDRENGRTSEARTIALPNDSGVKHKTTINSKNSHEHSTPDSGDLKSPVPPSEEEEEP